MTIVVRERARVIHDAQDVATLTGWQQMPKPLQHHRYPQIMITPNSFPLSCSYTATLSWLFHAQTLHLHPWSCPRPYIFISRHVHYPVTSSSSLTMLTHCNIIIAIFTFRPYVFISRLVFYPVTSSSPHTMPMHYNSIITISHSDPTSSSLVMSSTL